MHLTALILLACSGKAVDTASPPDSDAPDTPSPYLDEDRDGATEDVDCDDDNDLVFPGAREACDDLDNDCDEIVDEDPVDATDWYPDVDSDGYGDPDAGVEACDPPEGYISLGGDCDDGESTTNPDAAEICGDAVDNNCVGGDRPCGLSGDIGLADADARLVGAIASGRAGCAVALPGDLGSDGAPDVLIGACDAETTGVVYLVSGPGAGVSTLAGADARLPGALKDDETGAVVLGATLGGSAAVLVGAPGADYSGNSSGAIYLFDAPSGDVDASGAAHLYGSATAEGVGRALAVAGELLVVGAPLFDPAADTPDTAADTEAADSGDTAEPIVENAGAAWIVQGRPSGQRSLEDAATARLEGEADADNAGRAVAAGDLDGDGEVDFLVGAWKSDRYDTDAGAVYFVQGPVAGVYSLADADGVWVGEEARNGAGFAVVVLADMDGDGRQDLAVGAPASGPGAAYLLTAPPIGEQSLSEANARLQGESAGHEAGAAIDGGMDVDGDGAPDLVVSAPGHSQAGAQAGAVYLVPGPLSGALTLGATGARLLGSAAEDRVGESLALGDANGDGLGDILIGAPGYDDGASNLGAAYLIYGSSQ